MKTILENDAPLHVDVACRECGRTVALSYTWEGRCQHCAPTATTWVPAKCPRCGGDSVAIHDQQGTDPLLCWNCKLKQPKGGDTA